MSVPNEQNVLERNESVAAFFLGVIGMLPRFLPKHGIQDYLNNIRDAMQGLRPPRIMVIGRCKAGKSSLINAICGIKVARVSDTRPETGMAQWKEYHHNGVDLLHILDTRGLQETEAPRQRDLSQNPYDSIIKAVEKNCPDVVLFLCKASEVHSAAQEDVDICESIITKIKKKHKRDLPIIGVLTKCDELAPPQVPLPTNNERKNHNIQEQVNSFEVYLKNRENLRSNIKAVIPTVAYAEYQNGQNGLLLPEEDYRWNITKLVETMIQYTPQQTRGSLARMAKLPEFQLGVATTVVVACSTLSGVVSANPIPGTSITVVASIQTFMVMYIGWLGGRDFSDQTVKDFFVNFGVGLGANAGMIGIADIALKFIPGYGSILSAGASTVATKGLGDAAIEYFLKPKEQAN